MAHQHGGSRRRASGAEFLFVVGGVVAAAAAGVGAYRTVGPYADGPTNVGLYGTRDEQTGARLVYRVVPGADGSVFRYLYDNDSRRLREIRLARRGEAAEIAFRQDGDTVREVRFGERSVGWDTATKQVKIGFSLRGNGVIDAWEFRDPAGRVEKIEISRLQDGVIDRWEYYKDDQLARVEEDLNRDGKVDRWLTYDAGILMHEAGDKDGDGRPDSSD